MELNKVNIHAYDNVEQLQDFDNAGSIELYRNERLAIYKDHASYVESIFKGKKLKIVEIGSGSSAFIFQLSKKQLIKKGVGIEISKSRHKFAEKWKSDLNEKSIHNINENFNKVDLENNNYDIIFCIDNTFSYLQPENIDYPNLLIEKSWNWLRNGGLLILEMHNYKTIINKMHKNILYFWKKNKISNPFDYSLYKYDYDKNKNHLITESNYISKINNNKEKKEVSFVYDTKNIKNLFGDKFTIDHIFSDFKKSEYNSKDSNDMILICSKNKKIG